jgi:hypothetical protein
MWRVAAACAIVVGASGCGATEQQLAPPDSGASCHERSAGTRVATHDYEIAVTLSNTRALVRSKQELRAGRELVVTGGKPPLGVGPFTGREVSRLHVDVAVCRRSDGVAVRVAPVLVVEDRSSHERHPVRLLPLQRVPGGPSFHYGANASIPHQPIFDLAVGRERARVIPPNG